MAQSDKAIAVVNSNSTALVPASAQDAVNAAMLAAQATLDASNEAEDMDFGLDFAGAFAQPLPRDPKSAKSGKTVDGLTPVMRRMLWTWNPTMHNWRPVAVANMRGQNVNSTAQGNRKVGDAILYACTLATCPIVKRDNAPHFTVCTDGEVRAYGQRADIAEEQRFTLPPSHILNAIKDAPVSAVFVNKAGKPYPKAKYEGPNF